MQAKCRKELKEYSSNSYLQNIPIKLRVNFVMDLRPVFREFENDEYLVVEAQNLKNHGTSSEEMYILAHDSDRSKRVADQAGLNTLGIEEVGVQATLLNLL